MRRLAHYWPLLALALYYSLFFIQKISFVTADLGRHLVNGRVILQTGHIFANNYYSYTHQQFPAINHHWLFGVLAYLVQQLAGFTGLQLTNVAILSAAVFLMMLVAARRGGRTGAVVAAALVLPLITFRSEIRPESLSFFFVALYFFILDRATVRTLTPQHQLTIAVALGCVQVIWTNSHLFFVFGPLLVGYFWLRAVIFRQLHRGRLFILTALLALSTLGNPAGLAGALQPFRIFETYGYQVAENQSMPFMIGRLGTAIYWYSAMLIIGVVLLILSRLAKRARGLSWQRALEIVPDSALILCFALAAWQVNRLLSFFGLVLLPILAPFANQTALWVKKITAKMSASPSTLSLGSLGTFTVVVLVIKSQLFMPSFARFGFGMLPDVDSSAKFFASQQLRGPIFNNYDIGGYLIYFLYPTEKIFTDNRPEAYPAIFFTNEYIAAQEREDKWQELDEQYKFNVIYFYRHDATPWAQPFLLRRIDDPNWASVFVDDYTLILVKNNATNQRVIEQFRIPRVRFGKSS